jgi:hypothetical protein
LKFITAVSKQSVNVIIPETCPGVCGIEKCIHICILASNLKNILCRASCLHVPPKCRQHPPHPCHVNNQRTASTSIISHHKSVKSIIVSALLWDILYAVTLSAWKLLNKFCINVRYFREEMNTLSSMRRIYHHFRFIHCRLFCCEVKHTAQMFKVFFLC